MAQEKSPILTEDFWNNLHVKFFYLLIEKLNFYNVNQNINQLSPSSNKNFNAPKVN